MGQLALGALMRSGRSVSERRVSSLCPLVPPFDPGRIAVCAERLDPAEDSPAGGVVTFADSGPCIRSRRMAVVDTAPRVSSELAVWIPQIRGCTNGAAPPRPRPIRTGPVYAKVRSLVAPALAASHRAGMAGFAPALCPILPTPEFDLDLPAPPTRGETCELIAFSPGPLVPPPGASRIAPAGLGTADEFVAAAFPAASPVMWHRLQTVTAGAESRWTLPQTSLRPATLEAAPGCELPAAQIGPQDALTPGSLDPGRWAWSEADPACPSFAPGRPAGLRPGLLQVPADLAPFRHGDTPGDIGAVPARCPAPGPALPRLASAFPPLRPAASAAVRMTVAGRRSTKLPPELGDEWLLSQLCPELFDEVSGLPARVNGRPAPNPYQLVFRPPEMYQSVRISVAVLRGARARSGRRAASELFVPRVTARPLRPVFSFGPRPERAAAVAAVPAKSGFWILRRGAA